MLVLLLIFIWEYLQYIIKKIYLQNKINKNIVSFIHCLGCIILAYINLVDTNNKIIYYWSTSYFLWDTIKLLYNREFSSGLYMYHHVLCIWALNELYYNRAVNIISYLFYFGEISNIFNFIVYHLIKINLLKLILIK